MKSAIFLLFLLFASLVSYADVTEEGEVDNIILESNMVSFWLSGADEVGECSGGSRWVLQETDSLFKEKYSTLLAAFAAGKRIQVRSTGTCGNWNANRVYYINLMK